MKSILQSKKLLIATVVVVLIVIGIITVVRVNGSSDAKVVSKQLSLGEKYLSELEYEQAVIAFNKVIEIEPRNIRAYVGLAKAYKGLDQIEEAIKALETAITIAEEEKNSTGNLPEGSEDLYIMLAEIYEYNGDAEKAFQTLQKGYDITESERIAKLLEKYYPKVEVSIPSGNYETPQLLSMVSEGKKIYYTMDGSDPIKTSNIYNEPIEIRNGATTLKVVVENEFGVFGDIYVFKYNVTEKANISGNTIGNNVNGGTVAQQGEWIYYLTSIAGVINKVHTDGTRKTLICDDRVEYLNVIGNWIYYVNLSDQSNLYKIKVDGTERTKIGEDTLITSMCVVEDWIFYTIYLDESYSYMLYKIRTDGTDRVSFSTTDSYDNINVVDGWIYYSNCLDKDNFYSLYKMRLDGTERTKINSDFTACFNVVDDWIYYRNITVYDGCRLYKIRTDGEQKTKLNEEDSGFINVVDNWIYYVTYEEDNMNKQYLCKIRTDGTAHTVLKEGKFCRLNIANNWIYYLSSSKNDDTFDICCMIQVDGSQSKLVE